jgi:hypothetical protein
MHIGCWMGVRQWGRLFALLTERVGSTWNERKICEIKEYVHAGSA